jgi:hypothetical protein
MKWIRSILSIIAGLVVITVVAEGIEYLIVSVIMGIESDPNNPAPYFNARNQPLILGLKHVYNFASGFAGGYAAARIAGYKESVHGWVLMSVQALAILWAVTQPDMAQWMPLWAWGTVAIATVGGVFFGVRFRVGR